MRAQQSCRPRQLFGFAGIASATAQAHLRPHGAEGSTAYRASLQDVTASSYTSFQIQGIILPSLGSSPFVDLLRPPVEAGGRADALRLVLQLDAAGELDILQVLDGGELPVDQAGVGQRPQMLGRLQLGRVRRQEEPVDVLGM